MHSSSSSSSTDISHYEKSVKVTSPPSSSISDFLKSLFILTIIRKRQIVVCLLFFANFLFVNWLVDGDPTQGELLRVETAIAAKNSKKSESSPAHLWCLETTEMRQQWRTAQRIAGPSFRRRIDLCSPEAPSSSVFATTKQRNRETSGYDERLWITKTEFVRKERNATCGVTSVESLFSQSEFTTSWMIHPQFLQSFEKTLLEAKRETSGVNSHFLPIKIEENRRREFYSLCSPMSQNSNDVPLLHELQTEAKIIDIALLHSVLDKSEEIEHSLKFDHYKKLSDRSISHEQILENLISGTIHGSPILESTALLAQNMAAHSCATPSMTLASTVIIPGKTNDKANEFAAWRLWIGGPLIVASVCRDPPFEITVEVSPSSSWVEVIE
jgi:hypothetical protein